MKQPEWLKIAFVRKIYFLVLNSPSSSKTDALEWLLTCPSIPERVGNETQKITFFSNGTFDLGTSHVERAEKSTGSL